MYVTTRLNEKKLAFYGEIHTCTFERSAFNSLSVVNNLWICNVLPENIFEIFMLPLEKIKIYIIILYFFTIISVLIIKIKFSKTHDLPFIAFSSTIDKRLMATKTILHLYVPSDICYFFRLVFFSNFSNYLLNSKNT